MFHRVMEASALAEGAMEVVAIERKRWLIVWPVGDEPRAYRALCPHNESSLVEASFDGRTIVCPHHAWRFEGTSGACVSGQRCDPVRAYPLKIEDGGIFVDVPEKKKREAVASA